MTTKLNQILAVEKGVKGSTHSGLTEAHHVLQKPALLAGISRTYVPKDEEGERFPAEATRVQISATELVKRTKSILTRLFDVTATKDVTNCSARADVVVDGKVLASQVPATYLLFLEKQLVDLATFVKKLPTLDPSETWTFDVASGMAATPPVETVKTKKVPRNHVKAEATDKHPAQVEVYHEDIVVGTWRTTKFSGALPAATAREMSERIEKLQQAVKFAREEANTTPVTDCTPGDALLSYVFG